MDTPDVKTCDRCNATVLHYLNYQRSTKTQGKQSVLLCNSCLKNFVITLLQFEIVSFKQLEAYMNHEPIPVEPKS